MLNIIRADLFRILKGKGLYICFVLVAFFGLISVYTMAPGRIGISIESDDTNEIVYSGLSEEEFSQVYSPNTLSLNELREILINKVSFDLDVDIISSNVNLYYIFIVIAAIVICCDFSNGTIKNTVSTSISKRKYYFSKLVLSLILGTVIIFFNTYITYALCLILNGSNFVSSIPHITLITIKQLPYLYAIISVLVMISTFTRKTAVYNGIAIPLVMVFQLILTVFINIFNVSSNAWNYEFQTVLSKLSFDVSNTYLLQCICIGIVVIIGSSLMGYYFLKKKDI